MTHAILRVGILGAGYISQFHLEAIERMKNVQLCAVCDLSEPAARRLAGQSEKVEIYTDLATMLGEANLDVVHILTQADSHFALAKLVLESGCHCIIEKPATENSMQSEALAKVAKENGVGLAISHNFVFSRPFNRLKKTLDSGLLGPIKSVRVVWKMNLQQIVSGPWNIWMLRDPGNILVETGSHSLSELLAVVNDVNITRVEVMRPKILPSGSVFYRRWCITGESENTSIRIDKSFDYGYQQHFIEVEGLFGVATADIENDIFTINQSTGRTYDLERLSVNFREGASKSKQALKTYLSYAASKFLESAKGGPFEASIRFSIANCYDQLMGSAVRKESSIEYAIRVAKLADDIRNKIPATPDKLPDDLPVSPEPVKEPKINAEVLIVGASGFIGKNLLIALDNAGRKVRAVVRNSSTLVGVGLSSNCEVMVGDFRDQVFMDKVLQGIEVVFHLAVAHG
ncbi:MAG: Gfo/Idh/MocA family oxidoreductase, partial [bacterium]